MKKLIIGSSAALALILSFLTFGEPTREVEPVFCGAIECEKINTDEIPVLGKPAYIPTDEYYSSNQYVSMNHVGDIENVWDDYQGEGLTIAVIDSGIDYLHPDFYDENGNSRIRISEARWYTHITNNDGSGTYTTTNSSGTLVYFPVDSGTRTIDGVKYKGEEIVKHSLTSPYNSHGTNVAGTAAAFNHDTSHTGTIGIAPKAKILPIKVDFYTDSVGAALEYIYSLNNDSDPSNNVHVVNMSIEAPSSYTTINTYASYLVNKGTILVAAAGNSTSSTPSYPAANPNIIGVGALSRDSSVTLASYSNFNSSTATSSTSTNNTEVVAPGTVYAPNYTGSHTYVETYGTSFASPIVAGAALLWREANPTKSVSEFRTKLCESCVDIGSSGWDYLYGYGRIDIGNLLGESYPTSIVVNNPEIVDSNLTLEVGDEFDLDWTVNGVGSFDDSVTFSIYSETNDAISVDANGRITAIAEGSDLITITCVADENVTAEIMVTVTSSGSQEETNEEYTIGWGTASGTAGTYTNFTATSGSVSNILSFSSSKNSAANDPVYNSSSSELRLYYNSGGNGGSITITPADNVTFTGFVMTTSTSPTVKYSVDGGSLISVAASSNTYTVEDISASGSLKIQNANTSNTQLRIKTIKISYTVTTDTKALSSISISGYKTAFVEGDSFSFGGSVTAHFSDSSTSNVTPESTFTGYNMTEIGNHTVTVSYTYKGTEATKTYQITVSKGTLSSITLTDMTTTYQKNAAFSFDGTCTAIFENGYQKAVTPTFISSPDMSSLGNKEITVSYTYNGVTQSTTYNINVSSTRVVIEEGYSIIGTVVYTSGSQVISGTGISVSTSGYTLIENGPDASNKAIRLGSGSNKGTVTVTSTSSIIKKVVVNARVYNTDSPVTITIGGTSKSLSTSYADYEKEYTSATNSCAIATTSNGKRAWIKSITIYTYSSVDISSSDDCLGLETFINTCMHMDYVENLGYCNDSTHHYYSTARDAFNLLNDHQRSLFTSNDAYNLEWNRLSTWASINGESLNSSNKLAKSNTNLYTVTNDSQSPIIIIVLAITSIASIGVLLVIKKRRALR